MTLHDELQRIADRAPVADVPDDTWSRARGARKRDLALTIAGVAAVLALVAGAVAWVPGHLDPPIADTDSLGVPDHLYAVPERMEARENDDTWMRDEVTDDPTVVGVGAAAWLTNSGLPVVVGASDGAYHLLDLDDFIGNVWRFTAGLGSPVVSLSPDGRELAYGYAVFGPDSETEPIPSGIRVVDLTTGAVREIPVPGEEGTAVGQIEWSPDGSWLAFTGMQQSYWTKDSMGTSQYLDDAGPVLGRVPPGSDTPEVRSVGNDEVGLAVDDRGTVTWVNGRVRVWDQDGVTVTEDEDPVLQRALGSTADGAAVRLDGNGSGTESTVELVPADGSAEPVVVIPTGARSSLSLATELMSTDHPTVERPEPDWPWSEERISITIGLGVAAVIAAYLGLRWLVRRYWAAR